MSGNCKLAVDIGGTFTDIVLERGDRLDTHKVLTTVARPEQAVLEGSQELLRRLGLGFADVEIFVHGTTLATNAVLERRGARTALITTEGFRDVLEIGTESRHDQYDLMIEKRMPLVARALRFPVRERIDAGGGVREALDIAGLERIAARLREERIDSVAIGFIHSYANSAHEERAGEIIKALCPGVAVTLSSEVCPEIREYERFSTAVVNAYVQPLMDGYLDRMEVAFAEAGFTGTIYLVTSSGGLTSISTARRLPVRLVESGPAGGAIFAAHIAAASNEKRCLSFDMGGTTAKVCLIDEFRPQGERVYEVDRASRFLKGSGLPLRIPVIDLVEIGAGGGSIARLNALQNIAVGPESAGSEPGPACYGRGGQHPAVTDSNVVLGMVDPEAFGGGSLKLDAGAAQAALRTHLGEPLGLTPEMAAYAVQEIVCESMAGAARVHAVEKGKSASDYTLFAFGGAAPLHAARVAEKIGIERIIIPAHAGVGSAVGFLRAPISFEVVRTRHELLGEIDVAGVSFQLTEMEREASDLVQGGASGAPLSVRRTAFMRYVGQGSEIAVRMADDPIDATAFDTLSEDFVAEYRKLFDRSIPDAPIEILSWAVNVATSVAVPTARPACGRDASASRPSASRRFFDGRSEAFIVIDQFDRDALGPGAWLAGPALIVERETTTFVSSTFDVEIDSLGNIVMQRKSGKSL